MGKPEDMAFDEKAIDGVMPDIIDFVQRFADRKKMTFTEAMNFLLRRAHNKLASEDKYEKSLKCEKCSKKPPKCQCKLTPAEATARVEARQRRDDW